MFDSEGKRLYTGDGAGDVKIWNCFTTGADRHTSFSCQHTISGQRAVNCLRLNPRGSRLVVHTRNNQLRTIETKSFVEYKKYSGLRNERLMIKSDISPDGRYIISGSEDGQVYANISILLLVPFDMTYCCCSCIWNLERGDLVSARRPPLGYSDGHVTFDVRWNPTDNMVAVCTYGQPHPVLLWCRKQLSERTNKSTPLVIAYNSLDDDNAATMMMGNEM